MFSLLLAGALLCVVLIAFVFRSFLIIPWPVCALVDKLAWPLGWQTYVRAQGGPGWHLGRFGAEALYFSRRAPGSVRAKPLLRRRYRFALLSLLIGPFAALSLSACQTTNPITGDKIEVTDVQSAARAACSFLPTAETVAGIIKVGDARFTTAAAIAEAICDAINPNTPAGVMTLLKATPATVDGVVIRGKHVE